MFLSGCAVGMPLALTSAWISGLAPLGFAAWLCVRCRHALGRRVLARTVYVLLAGVLLLSGAFAALSLVSFASQTLAEQANHAWTEMTALLAIAACAIAGGTGTARLGFALRYVLPALVLGLSLAQTPMSVPIGLFPILGAGAAQTGMAALAMLFGVAPVLMLMLPPQEIVQADSGIQRVPPVRFFLGRVLLGAAAGVFLLFLTCAGTTYELIADNAQWGARLRMSGGNQSHEGLMQMLLMTAKLLAMLLLSVNMTCAAEQALVRAFPVLVRKRAALWLVMLLLGICFAIHVLLGDAPMLLCAPMIAAGAALTAALAGRRRNA